MDSQRFEYWQPQQEPYSQPQATYYEYTTPDLASIPSLSASPTSTATFDAAGTPTPTPQAQSQPMQRQQQQQQQQHYHHQNQPTTTYHQSSASHFAYALPVTPNDFGSVDAAVAASALPSPPYVCSPQQSHADLYGIPASSEAFPPLQIVNEQVGGFGSAQQGGRAPPVRSASNGSTWSAGSASGGVQAERTHVTSGRRRAQNRAAQRAFRERKEKHAKDLEAKLAVLSERYGRLEASHKELGEAYEKLRRTLELLTEPPEDGDDDDDDDADGEFVVEGLEGVVDEAEALLSRGLSRRRDLNERETLRKLVEILHAPRGAGGVSGGEDVTKSKGRRVKCEG
ncbi:hypothetical protein SLS57_009787 [Botryosphaeria dothidea]